MREKDKHLAFLDRRRLKKWKIEESDSEVFFVRTEDHKELAISSYSKKTDKDKLPVLLCHGLGSNRLSFDIDKEYSLTNYLVEHNYDVYVAELRGHGRSQKPSLYGKFRWGWGFNEYLYNDIPAIIDAILERSGKDHLHLIGHSLGGLITYALAAEQNDKIRSGIAIGSTLNYHGTRSVFHDLIKLLPLCKVLPFIPFNWIFELTANMVKYNRGFVDKTLVQVNNIDLKTYAKLSAVTEHPVSSRLLLDMASCVNGSGLKNKEGHYFEDLLMQKGYPFPLLSISGADDLQCAPEASSKFGTAYKIFGEEFGHKINYGHHDLVMGLNAPKEVWPEILNWLDLH